MYSLPPSLPKDGGFEVNLINKKMIDEKKLITPVDYAKKKGVTKQAIYKQMKLKQVKFKKIAGVNFIILD